MLGEEFASGDGPMTGLLGANWRWLVASAFVLPLIGVGCQNHGAKSKELLSVDLTRLKLHSSDTSLPAEISLVSIKSVRLLPKSVRSRIPKMSNPRGPFDAGDVSLFFDTPRRRLIFGGISDGYCLVHYEYGGIAHGYRTALFALSGNQAIPLWTHAGGRYDSLDQFSKETDPANLANDVQDAIF